eukprot:PITA_29297
MDDFTPYGDDFDQALQTLEKVLERCIATRLRLRNIKCHMLMIEGVILGHYISAAGIQVDPTKSIDNSFTAYTLYSDEVDDQFPDEHLFAIAIKMPWYADVANYLAVGKLPRDLTARCICEDEIYDILNTCHDDACVGHFVDRRIGHKVLYMGYYWPTIFKDAKKYAQACDSCQRMG